MSYSAGSLSEAGQRIYLAMRDAAASHVTSRIYAASPQLLEQFGEKGRVTCRKDIDYQLEFLLPALQLGDPRSFSEFLMWLSDVLTSRGVPSRHIPQALSWLSEYLREQMPDQQDREVVGATIAASLEALKNHGGQAVLYGDSVQSLRPECEQLVSALVEGDQRAAERVFHSELDRGSSLIDAGLSLIQPALYLIGSRWQRNEISVAQEHLATSMVQGMLLRAFTGVECANPTGRTVLLACVEGNHHTIGLRMVADALAIDGWQTRFLGADTPTLPLVQEVQRTRPDLLGLSASQPRHIEVLRQVVEAIHSTCGPKRPIILVGGLPLNQLPGLMAFVGADLTARDSREALELVQKRQE